MDRPYDEMPVSALNRFNYGTPITRVSSAPLNRELKGDQDKLPVQPQEAIKNDPPTKRLSYCGGVSKPYGKKK